MVQSAIPSGLQNLDSALGDEPMLFGQLSGWGAREAIGRSFPTFRGRSIDCGNTEIYNQRKDAWIEDEIASAARELDSKADEYVLSK